MHFNYNISLSNFFIAGVNYRKSDASMRGSFSVNEQQYENILLKANEHNISEVLILSTCNRTEIYGFAHDPSQLARLLTSATTGSFQSFESCSYTKNGKEAIEHLFNVACGLDSQILGDYEIVGQIKQAAKFSKQRNMLGTTLERLVNEVLQTCKKVRTNTSLSGGTVSVSFAAVQFIRAFSPNVSEKSILLIGAGKFGACTLKNISDYLRPARLTIMNRTLEKARDLASKYNAEYLPAEQLGEALVAADIILVATGASEAFVHPYHFKDGKARIVIDLSVPCNVAVEVKSLGHIRLINVDELSKIKDETLQKRSLEIPKVKQIISEHVEAFMDWCQLRQHVPVLKAIKSKLKTIQADRIFEPEICMSISSVTGRSAEERIQKVINGMAVKMKIKNQRGCQYIEAINDFISPVSK